MDVPDEAKEGMLRDGFAVLRGAVPRPLLDAAVRAINAELGKGVPADELSNFKNGLALPTLMHRPVITDLFSKSGARAIVASFLGADHFAPGAGQIALRFPGAQCLDDNTFTPAPWTFSAWHIDGLTDERERWAKRGTLAHFSCLVGVALRDVPAPNHGNLIVYPGSHRVIEAFFNQDPANLTRVASEGEKGLPQFLPFKPHVQVCLRAGDVVVCHYQLAHSVAANTSPEIRYVVYFRVHARKHPPGPNAYRPEALRDIWRDWDGMRHTIDALGPTLDPVVLDQATLVPRGTDAPSTMNANATPQSTRPPVTLTPQQLDALVVQAGALFDREKWAEARPGFQQLSDAKPHDYTFALKAAVCYGLGDIDFKEGRPYYDDALFFADRLIKMTPDMIQGYCLRVRALVGAGRYEDAIKAFDAVLSSPTPSESMEWSKGLIVDSAKCAAIAMHRTGKIDMVSPMVRAISDKYPDHAEAFKMAHFTPETQALLKQGEAMMAKEPKDWKLGQDIFSKLAQMAPDIFHVQLQAAACFTYGAPDSPALLRRGEEYAGMAIGLEPTCAAGYGVLARNLAFQGRFAEVLPVADTLLQCRYEPMWGDLIVDGLRCVRQAHQRLSLGAAATQHTAARFKQQFPELAPRLEQVLHEQGCCIL